MRSAPGDTPLIDVGRTIATRLNELRLQAALEEAHRARLAYLREDLFDGDCDRCARKVREAEERAARLEAVAVGRDRRHEPGR
ncbi:MAG TPA: hypothetical protein VES19_08280 [Candidatus Limnocylindrales bacterium]|nr:hypothetical protein [Candidatus Limnocylindrales bacterium]